MDDYKHQMYSLKKNNSSFYSFLKNFSLKKESIHVVRQQILFFFVEIKTKKCKFVPYATKTNYIL